jgi:hypothetical protein
MHTCAYNKKSFKTRYAAPHVRNEVFVKDRQPLYTL